MLGPPLLWTRCARTAAPVALISERGMIAHGVPPVCVPSAFGVTGTLPLHMNGERETNVPEDDSTVLNGL